MHYVIVHRTVVEQKTCSKIWQCWIHINTGPKRVNSIVLLYLTCLRSEGSIFSSNSKCTKLNPCCGLLGIYVTCVCLDVTGRGKLIILTFSGSKTLMARWKNGTNYSKCLQTYPFKRRVKPHCHLVTLLGAHNIIHVSRVSVKVHFKALNAELNPICHLLALLGSHHIIHVWLKEILTLQTPIKSDLPSAGVIKSSPYSPS